MGRACVSHRRTHVTRCPVRGRSHVTHTCTRDTWRIRAGVHERAAHMASADESALAWDRPALILGRFCEKLWEARGAVSGRVRLSDTLRQAQRACTGFSVAPGAGLARPAPSRVTLAGVTRPMRDATHVAHRALARWHGRVT